MSDGVEGRTSKVESQRPGPPTGGGESLRPSTLDLRPDLPPDLSPNQRAWRRFLGNRPAVVSLAFISLLLLAVVLWPTAAANQVSDLQFHQPGTGHVLGTDVHGRDLLARMIAGARISLLVGAVGAGVSLVIGVLWGAIAGYVGGRTDSLLMRVVDILYCLPNIVFVMVLITTLEKFLKEWLDNVKFGMSARLLLLFAGLGAISWLTMARIVRGQVLSLRTRQFVDASRALGASHTRILLRHILPNVTGIIIVYLALTVPAIILYESFLSFLGLGIQPPMARDRKSV